MPAAFANLRAAAIDGRAHNIYYRQSQIEKLHQTLIGAAQEIKEALSFDYNYSPAEVAAEINLTLEAIKRDYASLQPAKALEDEYLLANGSDAPGSRQPAGIVYIEPCAHTLLFSTAVPLSAALAAGNCVIVLLENSLKRLPSILRQALQSSLHPDTFAIASSPVSDPNILSSSIFVDQNSSETWPRLNHLASLARSGTVAVVDRTADVKLAAKELVAARFAFGGTSPYAPDLVLVNEFVKQAFLQAVVDGCREGRTGTRSREGKAGGANKLDEQLQALKKVDPRVQIVVQEAKAAVAELSAREAQALSTKDEASIMKVIPVKSLDDAIDLIGNTSSGAALAAYHFGTPAVGKYLAQFIDARASFINHVPRGLLVGPAYPATHALELSARYTPDMFSWARPGFANVQPSSASLAAQLAASDSVAVQKVLKQALGPLKAMKRKPGGGVGFFEQGFLMNAGLILTFTISATAIGSVWLWRNARMPW
ncbi:hypothetical protein WHR41_09073 [Cladosporium halotolerans]|uniref:Aldehyde dehydrogenase domain-containing protein n=1 Tax=Cladosporium halotolerans TaxID=1052096 RepID=A0AB34KB37_9PEZI